jgi:hypothetical protein
MTIWLYQSDQSLQVPYGVQKRLFPVIWFFSIQQPPPLSPQLTGVVEITIPQPASANSAATIKTRISVAPCFIDDV